MPRTTKLTPERQKKIVVAILNGNYFETACACAGIAAHTGFEWLARGEARDKDRPTNSLYASFAHAVREAEAKAEAKTVAVVVGGFEDNPRLALDFLARRHPGRWGQRDTLMILKKLEEEMKGMSDAEVIAFLSRRDSRQGARETGQSGSGEEGTAD